MPEPSSTPNSSIQADRTPAGSTIAASPAEIFVRLVRGVGGRRWDELPGLYAERTHVVHPHDPGRGAPLLTREELRKHFAGGASALGDVRFEPAAITVHETADPEVVIGEFEYRGVVPGTGEPFALPGIFVLRVRNGEIVSSRVYFDHFTAARVHGQLDALIAAVR